MPTYFTSDLSPTTTCHGHWSAFAPAKQGPRSIKPDEGITPNMGQETEASGNIYHFLNEERAGKRRYRELRGD
jgi:hypothetical protein